MTDTWEERMAAKSRDRQEAEDKRLSAIWRIEDGAEYLRNVADYMDTLTPETAREQYEHRMANPIGCACVGGPRCCRITLEALERALGI